jgi:hypothetical protein
MFRHVLFKHAWLAIRAGPNRDERLAGRRCSLKQRCFELWASAHRLSGAARGVDTLALAAYAAP